MIFFRTKTRSNSVQSTSRQIWQWLQRFSNWCAQKQLLNTYCTWRDTQRDADNIGGFVCVTDLLNLYVFSSWQRDQHENRQYILFITECECECGQTIIGWTNFQKHSENCTGIKGNPYRCQKFGAAFASQDGRKEHARNVRTYFISSV